MSRKFFALLTIVCIISISAGFWIGKIQERRTWQERFNELVRSELDLLTSQLEIHESFLKNAYHISGVIVEKGDNFLVVEGQSQINKTGGEINIRNIKINITEETEIFRFIMVDLTSDSSEKVILSLDDLKLGEYLYIVSKEDAREIEEIIAEKIQVSCPN